MDTIITNAEGAVCWLSRPRSRVFAPGIDGTQHLLVDVKERHHDGITFDVIDNYEQYLFVPNTRKVIIYVGG